MRKGEELIILGVILVFLILGVSFVSAGIYFSQPQSVYNLGDMVELEATVSPISTEYLLSTYLICNGDEILSFNNMPDSDGKVSIKFPLSVYTIKETSGTCYFSGRYADSQEVKSRTFEISKKLDVRLSADSLFTKPGEAITISGSVKRLNGVGINGEVEVRMPFLGSLENVQENKDNLGNESDSNESSSEKSNSESDSSVDNGVIYGKVTNGEFSLSFNLKEDTPSGDYKIDLVSYEKSNDKKTNEGSASASLKIFQILKSADIALSEQNIDPGKELNFKPMLLDQTGKPYYDKVSIIVEHETGDRIYENLVDSEQTINFKIATNTTAGNYEIQIASGSVSTNKKFYINEKALVTFKIENETLIITNIGNIPYNKSIQVYINGKPFLKKITNLGLGESEIFKLTGANDKYDIKVSDGENEIFVTGVPLTGGAVAVTEIRKELENIGGFKTPLLWLVLIIVLLGVGLFFFRFVFKKRSYAYPQEKSKKTNEIKLAETSSNFTEVQPGTIKFVEAPTVAEQTLVSNGQKSNVSVMVVKLKNNLTEESKLDLKKAMEPVYEKKGAIYEQGDYLTVIFSPLVTGDNKNEIESIRVADKIANILKEHNRKFKERIEFGIGINCGDIINKVDDKKLKFTQIGTTILISKRLSEVSNEKVLISKEIYEKSGMNEVKAERKNINEMEFYEVTKVMDYSQNKKFIKDFLGRQGKDVKVDNFKSTGINKPYWNKDYKQIPNTSFRSVNFNNKNKAPEISKKNSFESINKPFPKPAPQMPNPPGVTRIFEDNPPNKPSETALDRINRGD